MLKIVKKPPAEAKAEASPAEPKEGKTSKASVKAIEGAAMLESFPPMCVVSVEVGYSHKLPSEDWIKVGVRLDIPCKYEDIDKMYDYAKGWTDAKLNASVEEITAGE
jgi:hypothetical protein